MIRGGTGENARLREQRKATDAQNNAELLAYTNELLAKEWDAGSGGVEGNHVHVPRAAASSAPYDEHDDQWSRDWDEDFDRSREEWERFA